jgi:hypothetical protein
MRNRRKTAPYSWWQWFWAVNLSAVFGWGIITIYIVGWPHPNEILVAAYFGLPIAFLVTWVGVAPVLLFVMYENLGWYRAAFWGAVSTVILAILRHVLVTVQGMSNLMATPYFQKMTRQEQIEIAIGKLTRVELGSRPEHVLFILLGVFTAILVRACIGPGMSKE